MEQAARDGILIAFRAAPETWQQGNECYYYYTALWIKAKKESLRQFVDTYQVLSVSDLNKLLPPADCIDPDEQRAAENIKQIHRVIQARDRRRRRKLEDEQRELENQIIELMEAERDECYEHRNDLNWLVARIESMGWEVTLRSKPILSVQIPSKKPTMSD